MIRKTLNINDYKYLCDFYDAYVDVDECQHFEEFVMLRNVTIMNNIAHDNAIIFISKSLFQEFKNSDLENNTTDKLVWPAITSRRIEYSRKYKDFNDTFDEWSLSNDDVYELYEMVNGVPRTKSIQCNKIRIYHPSTKKRIDSIIILENYINNIHFFYVCNKYDSYKVDSNTEISYNNNKYSEYIDVYFPNLNEIFKSNDNKYYTFYKENLNYVVASKNQEFINTINRLNNLEMFISGKNEQLVPINLLLQPFRIIEEETNDSDLFGNNIKTYAKLYIKNYKNHNNSYVAYPINLTIYPYTGIDNFSERYMEDEDMLPSSVVFNYESRIRLSARFGFDENGYPSIVGKFIYPSSPNIKNIKDAYKYFNDVDENDYLFINNNDFQAMIDSVNETKSLSDQDIEFVVDAFRDNDNRDIFQNNKELASYIKTYNSLFDKKEKTYLGQDKYKLPGEKKEKSENDRFIEAYNYIFTLKSNKAAMLNIYKALKLKNIMEEIEEELGVSMNFIGFKLEISSDPKFSTIIYERNVDVQLSNLDDISLNINNIFSNWLQMPPNLIARLTFIDKFISKAIISNVVHISKDDFKYMIDNGTNTKRITTLYNKNANMKEFDIDNSILIDKINALRYKSEDIDWQNTIDELLETLQEYHAPLFVNTLKCNIVKRYEDTQNILNDSKLSSNSTIILKPIFYKVSDLQNIRLKENILQNVGINLNRYMTKVETFKIIINGKEYIESGRNDIYVIFPIDTNLIINKSGSYDITNQDDEYISSGRYVIE